MKLLLKPEHFQTVHYYFFSLGMFSLTIAFMFPTYNFLSYIFMTFYVFHSAMAWYMSWFMHKRMEMVYVIRETRYIINHAILTVLSGGLAVAFYQIFQDYFEAMMTSILAVNFFVIFLGFIWYFMGLAKITGKFFEWQGGRKLRGGMEALKKFRNKNGIVLVSDKDLERYKFGTNSSIDKLFMDIKLKSEKGGDFAGEAKEVEVRMSQLVINDLEKKIKELKNKKASTATLNLEKSYSESVEYQRKKLMEYEKAFYKKFGHS